MNSPQNNRSLNETLAQIEELTAKTLSHPVDFTLSIQKDDPSSPETISALSGQKTLFSLPLPTSIPSLLENLKRTLNPPSHIPLHAEWKLDTTQRSCVHPKSPAITLTEKESTLLLQLTQSHTPIPRESLQKSVWGMDKTIDSHTVETHIYRLRQKLEPIYAPHDPITNKEGGYVLYRV